MFRPPLTSVHVAPASLELNSPPLSCSTSAYTRFGSAPDTDTPIRPITPRGRLAFRVSSCQVSPPSVDLNSPLPGPPLDIWYSTRYASHIAAYSTFGFVASTLRSIAPVRLSRKSVFSHVCPPSVLLNTPRSAFGAPCFPNAATQRMFGFVGWMRIFEMFSDSRNPMCVHVFPASVDLYTPSPPMMLPRMHVSPVPM